MKAKLRGRIKHFLKSEEGRVGLKTPLALGVASGSILLAQMMLGPSAYAGTDECGSDADCSNGLVCRPVCDGTYVNGTCIGYEVKKCVDP